MGLAYSKKEKVQHESKSTWIQYEVFENFSKVPVLMKKQMEEIAHKMRGGISSSSQIITITNDKTDQVLAFAAIFMDSMKLGPEVGGGTMIDFLLTPFKNGNSILEKHLLMFIQKHFVLLKLQWPLYIWVRSPNRSPHTHLLDNLKTLGFQPVLATAIGKKLNLGTEMYWVLKPDQDVDMSYSKEEKKHKQEEEEEDKDVDMLTSITTTTTSLNTSTQAIMAVSKWNERQELKEIWKPLSIIRYDIYKQLMIPGKLQQQIVPELAYEYEPDDIQIYNEADFIITLVNDETDELLAFALIEQSDRDKTVISALTSNYDTVYNVENGEAKLLQYIKQLAYENPTKMEWPLRYRIHEKNYNDLHKMPEILKKELFGQTFTWKYWVLNFSTLNQFYHAKKDELKEKEEKEKKEKEKEKKQLQSPSFQSLVSQGFSSYYETLNHKYQEEKKKTEKEKKQQASKKLKAAYFGELGTHGKETPRYPATKRPVTKMEDMCKKEVQLSDLEMGLYLPVVRYPIYYVDDEKSEQLKTKEKHCGTFYFFEPHSRTVLNMGKCAVFATKAHAFRVLVQGIGNMDEFDVLDDFHEKLAKKFFSLFVRNMFITSSTTTVYEDKKQEILDKIIKPFYYHICQTRMDVRYIESLDGT